MEQAALYVGMDVHKATAAIAVAESGRDGEVRFIGNVANKSSTVIALLRKLEDKHGEIECAYEAGPSAYTLYRQLIAAGLACIVVVRPVAPHRKTDCPPWQAAQRLARPGADLKTLGPWQ